jgi:hypothetical protein
VWYRGETEPVNPQDVADLDGITFHDSEAMGNELKDWRIGFMKPGDQGWANKLYALTHTKLETVFFVDADAYFVSDPTPMLELAEQERFVFWDDLQKQDAAVKWHEVWPPGCKGVPPIQGGQLAMHRPSFWPEIAAAHWMCQHADYYFQRMFGDQDTWRVALAASRGTYRSLGPAPWVTPAFTCSYAGTPVVVHRCQGKLIAGSQSRPKMHLPREQQVFEIVAKHFPLVLR